MAPRPMVNLGHVRITAQQTDADGTTRFWRIESRRARLDEVVLGQAGSWPQLVLHLGVPSWYQSAGAPADTTMAWALDEAELAERFPWHDL